METVAVSFFILFGSSYGISSVLLKKNIHMHDPSYKSQIISTKETYFDLERYSAEIRACKDSGDSVSIVISYEILKSPFIPT